MLRQRVITAIIIVPIFLAALIWLPNNLFSLFTGVIVLLGAWEWAKLMNWNTTMKRTVYMAIIAVIMYFASFFKFDYWFVGAAIWWLMALYLVAKYPTLSNYWARGSIVRGLMGVGTLIPCWLAINAIHQTERGWQILLIMVIAISLADVGAYFGGKRFGKRKLAPNVSPGKTIEGFISAILVCNLFALVTIWFIPLSANQYIGWYFLILITVTISVLGDLTESMLKRQVNIKDSSQILPGHGGILDRIDSYTAGAPIFALGLMMLGLL